MPNYIQNKLEIIGEKSEIKKVFDYTKSINDDGKEIQIDFNKIIPMPEELSITSNSLGSMVQALLFGEGDSPNIFTLEKRQRDFTNLSEEQQREGFELALKYHQNKKQFGFETWYDWSIHNWGVEWNALEQNDKRNTESIIYFVTAWSPPLPVIKKLSQLFPLVQFILTYADEDVGHNVGIIYYEKGKMIKTIEFIEGSKEAYNIYFELYPNEINNYKLINNKYEYIDN